jgi:hypothetical protein
MNSDLSTNDISTNDILDDEKKDIDYKRVEEIVKDCSRFFSEIEKFVLWVMACDYYLKEELKLDVEEKEEYKDIYEKCKAEFKRTKEYTGVNVITDVSE